MKAIKGKDSGKAVQGRPTILLASNTTAEVKIEVTSRLAELANLGSLIEQAAHWTPITLRLLHGTAYTKAAFVTSLPQLLTHLHAAGRK